MVQLKHIRVDYRPQNLLLMYKQTLGLANHVIDLNVANLLIKSPRSHGLQTGACEVLATVPDECWNPSPIFPLSFNSVNIDLGRFLPLDDGSSDELKITEL